MNPFARQGPKKLTARCRVATSLTQEILNESDPRDFPIASEHQLCRRFGVSRVTIRLALSDLEHRRLIYRCHGKGTFAYGRSNRIHPNLGIFLKSPDALRCPGIVEFIRGAQTVMTSINSSLVLIGTSPLSWRMDMTNTLGAVIVIQESLSPDEVDNLRNLRLPFICIPYTQLNVGDKDYFHLGLCAAEALDHAVLAGESIAALSWPELP